ncbi:hypothetical protein ACFQY4_21260 [Catellatospora bangladeshensis]|uniref:Uncharacterized protein n=1 Tax=Catellatospora bangladeshensis TaxID=310355 RepID=A0A8J3NKF8_9ACTN|nr:hypothetical protein [Catellatospora bangladeshensis]GIF84400.1 hypothetical protein Cba03nite_57490 [Catellatospora bangladeshensis]
MTDNDWHGPVNQLLYCLTLDRQLTDEVVDRVARLAVERGALRLGPQAYHDAATRALAAGADLTELPMEHDQQARADFLRRFTARLDELRPWPETGFVKQDAAQWASFARAVPVARLDAPVIDVRNVLRERFDRIGAEGEDLYALILRLGTGETVALLGSYAAGQRVTLLQRDPGDPETLRRHFQQATGFPAEKIQPL